MRTERDQFAKELLRAVLDDVAVVRTGIEIETAPQQIDVFASPRSSSDRDAAYARLGWLGRMVEQECLIEPFSSVPSAADLRSCLRKQLAWEHEAKRRKRRRPAPMLWVISYGDPRSHAAALGLAPCAPWPSGFRFASPFFRLALVVLRALPRTRDTVLLRLLGRGEVLRLAVVDARALSAADPLWTEVRALIARRRHIAVLFPQSLEPNEAAMYEELFQEFVKQTRGEGKAEGKAEGVLVVLAARGLTLTEEQRARILATSDSARLEVWLARAVTATSAAEIFEV